MKAMWKRTVLIVVLLLISVAAIAAQSVYKVGVDGLACPFCAYGVEKKLSAIKGVQRVDVDIKTGIVTVTMMEGAALDNGAAQQAVKDAGFSMRSFEQLQAGPRGN